MATYGLQTNFMNKLLKEYFGLESPDISQKEIYIGLGLSQQGAHTNTDDFTEVFSGRPLGNYKRARAIFGKAEDCVIFNVNEVYFPTASEDWTDNKFKVDMIGVFDTLDYEDPLTKELVKPLIVLRLPRSETVLKGETIILAPEAIQLSLTDL